MGPRRRQWPARWPPKTLRQILNFLPRLWANWITLFGAVLTTVSGLAILSLFAMQFGPGTGGNAYSASLLVVVLPGMFAAGLVVIPFGLWIDRRRRLHPDQPPDELQEAFSKAMHSPSARKRIVFFGVTALVNVFVFSFAGHAAITYMDSPKFCGTTCHVTMEPEWDAYNRSPHSRVACVTCHIGPGASWGAKAKINGLHQVWGVLTNTNRKPVPTPVEQLRPSRDTCEQCHWPQKFAGSHIKLFPHYKPDEKNTPSFNAMMLRIGGENPRTKNFEGIHWHVGADHQVQYEFLDRERTRIGKVTVLEKGKVATEYLPPAKETGKALGVRTMDCVDCHNRPTHVMDRSAASAVDKALFAGALDAKIPFIAKVSGELLTRADPSAPEADAWFKTNLAAEYAKLAPPVKLEGDALDKTAAALGVIYRHNVFPAMKVGFGTYRSNIGHQGTGDKPGCFRCHDKEHEATLANGTKKKLTQSCENCHETLAFEENPSKLDDTLKALIPRASN